MLARSCSLGDSLNSSESFRASSPSLSQRSPGIARIFIPRVYLSREVLPREPGFVVGTVIHINSESLPSRLLSPVDPVSRDRHHRNVFISGDQLDRCGRAAINSILRPIKIAPRITGELKSGSRTRSLSIVPLNYTCAPAALIT